MVKNLPVKAGDVGQDRSPGESKWQPAPVFLPGKTHEQRSLVGLQSWGHKRVSLDMVTKQLLQTSLVIWGGFQLFLALSFSICPRIKWTK